jgi:N-methylhydantoinase B
VAVKALIETVDEFAPGDAYICNDPHTAGATHPPDTNVISPIFYDGRLVGFAQSQAHLLDTGGMAPGGFAPAAYDCFGEALRMGPGVKLYENGEPIEYVKRLILNNIRVPVPYWNDVRSLVASNTTGTRRLTDTIDELGYDEFVRYAALARQKAEDVVRLRIAAIPDGRYESDEYIEHNGHTNELVRIRCALVVDGDGMVIDFTGSDPQTDGFVNSSFGSTVGAVATVLAHVLAPDVPFNQGVLAPFEFRAPEGTVVNPTPPAPVSNGHLAGGVRASRVVTRLLNEAMAHSSDANLRSRVQGEWGDAWTGGISAGLNDAREFYVWFNMDGGGMGTGAQTVADGHDAAGLMCQVGNMLPDVEMNEMLYPALYLHRRLALSSCGHGASRGGFGLDFAWTLWHADECVQTVFSPVAQLPPWGFAGGLPAGGSGHVVLRDTNVKALLDVGRHATVENLEVGERDELDINAQGLSFGPNDVFIQWICGGGGLGDPLLRDPALVEQDVHDGYVTEDVARDVYGVVLGDPAATAARRRALRDKRLGREPVSDVTPLDLLTGDLVPARNGDGWSCPACHGPLGSEEDWRAGAVTRRRPLHERLAQFGVRVRPREIEPSLGLDGHYCPSCGTLLRVQVSVLAT